MVNREPSPTSHPQMRLKETGASAATATITARQPRPSNSTSSSRNNSIADKKSSENISNNNNEKSTCVVAPSLSYMETLAAGEAGVVQQPSAAISSSSFRVSNSEALPPAPQVVSLPPGAASMLARFKPFAKKSDEALKLRIGERKRIDDERARRKELEETRLVDGQLVVDDDDDDESNNLANDPKLAEGKLLPKAVANHFPKYLLGTPVEDIDPRNREYDETFMVISRRFNKTGYIYRFSAKPSLYIFRPWFPIRRLALYAYTHPLFDVIVIFTILANSLSMAMNITETIPAIYTMEGIIKAIARGLIVNKHTYLRDGWNWLDFIVLVSAYATIIAQSVSSATSVNIQALRTFRVFRVLKTIAIIPGLKSIIEALMRALRMLGDVLIMTVFFFTIFALFGLQLFQGTLSNKCIVNAEAIGIKLSNGTTGDKTGPSWSDWIGNSSNWIYQDNGFEFMVCGNTSGAQQCPVNSTCIQVDGSPNPNNDFSKFDNFYSSFMIAVQIFNTDYWDFLYHDVVAANGPAAFLFFIVAIVFLNYYLANLVQAVVALSYQIEDEDDSDEGDEDGVQTSAKREPKRRFVFDPLKLRSIQGRDVIRSRSLQSVRSVTEKRLGVFMEDQTNNNNNDSFLPDGTDNKEVLGGLDATGIEALPTQNTGKPVAVVKPQKTTIDEQPAGGMITNRHNNKHVNLLPYNGEGAVITDSYQEQEPHQERNLRYQIASRPPSAISVSKLSEIDGYWDRNPPCCVRCCWHVTLFRWLRIQNRLMAVVTDPFFELFITAAIIVNTVSMAAYYHRMPQEWVNNLGLINDICTYIFITEAVLKLTAMCKEYFVNRWNWLDFIVVIGSIIDIVFSNINVFSSGGFNIQTIRLLRLLRILKLAQSWKTMRLLLEIILGTVGAIGNLMIVLLIVIFIFAVIGMQLFGGTYTDAIFLANPTFTPFPGFTGVPEWNWDDFFHAFMMVFRVLCRETYQPMWDCISANSAAICVPFYIATLIVGSYVVLNLFLAVLLNAFNSDELKKASKDAEENRLRQRLKKIRRFFKKVFASFFSKCCPKFLKLRSLVAPAPNPSSAIERSGTGGTDIDFDRATTVQDPDVEPDLDDETGVQSDQNKAPEEGEEETTSGERHTDVNTTGDGASTTTAAPTGQTSHTARSTASHEVSKMRDCCWPVFDRLLPKLMAHFTADSPTGSSLLKARSACFKLCNHKAFEFTILGFIFASSLSLCLQDATLVEGSTMDIVLNYMDYVYLGVFAIELVIKLCAFGIRTYFTSFWTILDFIIVATGFIDVGMSTSSMSVNLSSLRALRTLRALRPLRAISRWQGMKIVVNALITAVPGIINVLLVVLIIWLIFAIMGVQFFSGKFWMCIEIATGNRIQRALAPNKAACVNNTNWAWTSYFVNYDNVANAYLAIFQMATFEGWTMIYQLSVDAPEQIDDQPAPELNVNYYVYYIVFIVICSFFLLNLFVGVIIDDFNALKKKYEGGTALLLFMTETQKRYYSTIKQLGSRKPKKAVAKPKNKFGALIFDIANSQRFEYAIAIVIGANVVVMTTEHFNQENVYTMSQDMLNLVFTTIFTMEALLKIGGLRWNYFKMPWNVFDFAVVIFSILSIALNDLMVSNNVSPSLLRLLRVLRVGRIIRLFRAWKGVRKLMLSFIMSLPALFNIACLLFLIIFIYAIIGMNLFGHVGHFGGNLDDMMNFHTFPYALLTLFRLTTMSGWDNVHQGLSFTDDLASGCNPNADLLDPNYPRNNPCCNRTAWVRPNGQLVYEQGGGWGNCGNISLATVFLVSYLLLSYFIIVNMFAAVILDNYQQATQQEDIGVTDDDIEHFYIVWEQYDPLATQFIKYQDLTNLVAALEPPLGLPKPNEYALTLLDFPIMKDRTSGEEIIHCLDVLMGVVRKALGFMEETDDFVQVKDNLEAIFKKSFPSRIQVQQISSTKQRKKEEVASRVIQKSWRKHIASQQYRQAVVNKSTKNKPENLLAPPKA